eukprot:TRINITY_DN10444_c0_g1_i1.p1 TRINITY_DN10444_c0_g1~~TRINITY_DN10444_c0_g1_i1.p1  ORF type:complete len:277 (-),score=28.40 TRINITY_DN10444_c0_g1_i1:156-986(-)
MGRCAHCCAMFTDKAALSKHQRFQCVQNPDRIFLQCEECHCAFRTPFTLQRHEQSERHKRCLNLRAANALLQPIQPMRRSLRVHTATTMLPNASEIIQANTGKYVAILADPPWDYDQASHQHYETMTLAQLQALPIASLGAADSALFLWATGPKLQEALSLMVAWGYSYRTLFVVWVKLDHDDEPVKHVGNFTQSCVELLLVGTRGALKAIKRPGGAARRLSQLLQTERGAHSAKPRQVHGRIAQFVKKQAMKIELFARGGPKPGWHIWGDEAGCS